MRPRYARLADTNFYDPENYAALQARLERLLPTAERRWGQMTVDQMLHHLNRALGCGLGYYDPADSSNWVTRNLVQFVLLRVLRRFPISAATPAPLAATESYDFAAEKARLQEILARAYATQSDADWGRHPYFGRMSRRDWGELIMLHCHHHFEQFGV
jgi:hypothetical protein